MSARSAGVEQQPCLRRQLHELPARAGHGAQQLGARRRRRNGGSSIARRVGTSPASAPSSGPERERRRHGRERPAPAAWRRVKTTQASSAKRPAPPVRGAGCRSSSRGPARRCRSGARASISGSSCQSPRVQRCTRDAATPAWCGWSSTSTRSLTIAQRATVPSSRSWLSTAPSGRRRSSVACSARTFSRPLPVKEPVPNTSW